MTLAFTLTWAVIGTILSLPVVVVLLTFLVNRLTGKHEERRQLQRDGSAAITPAKELVHRLGPESIMWGTDEQRHTYLNERFKEWSDELRPPLMVYLNQHPSARVRRIGERFATAVGNSLAATRFHLLMEKTTTTMKEFEASERAKNNALALADDLLAEIRRGGVPLVAVAPLK
jgi:hypothetical protein